MTEKAWKIFKGLSSKEKDNLVKLVCETYPNDSERIAKALNDVLISKYGDNDNDLE